MEDLSTFSPSGYLQIDSQSMLSNQRIGSSRRRKYFGWFITSSQVAFDFITPFLCYVGSYWFYTDALNRLPPQSLSQYLVFAGVSSLVYVAALEKAGLYHREISLLNIKELRGIFRAGIYAALIILSTSFYFRSVSLSRITLTVSLIGTPILLYLERQFFYRLHVLFHLHGWSQTKVLIFGTGSTAVHLAKRMCESPSLGLMPFAFLSESTDERVDRKKTLQWKGICPQGGVQILYGEDWITKAKEMGIDQLFIAHPGATFEQNQMIVQKSIESDLFYAIVPNSYEKLIQKVELFEIGGIPLLRRKIHNSNRYYLVLKRFFDFLLSSFLLVVLSPLYFVIGSLIRWESPGPVLFKQKRVGLNGRQFTLYKFRSMYLDAPKYAYTPTSSLDPRITKIGRWLRRSSLDELPQLFNIFRGNMSFVGPRPEMPFIVEKYTSYESERLKVKPGITGVWQISAVRGEPIHHNMEYDLFYLENQSILLDLAIIFKTVISAIRGIGAV